MKLKLLFCITAAALVFSCVPALPPPELTGRLAGLRLGDPIQCENLTVIPIFSDKPDSQDDLVPLEIALENKWLEIKEIDSGEVPTVKLHNNSDKKIFILSGQVITGCKQDRIIAGDRIIRPHQRDIDLDVFCVEAGRWTAESEGFYTKKNMGTAGLREKAQRKQGSSQSEIWNEIAQKNMKLKVDTDTSAYQDAYDQEAIKQSLVLFEDKLTEAVDTSAVGVVIGIGGKLKSTDVFDNANLFRHYWPGILKASSLDAIASEEKGALSRDDAQRLLAAAGAKEFKPADPKDETRGTLYLDDTINANEMKSDGKQVHFSLFPVEKKQTDQLQRIEQQNNNIINQEEILED